MQLAYLIFSAIYIGFCLAGHENDGDTSRKILGSSVVTSVSVVMDTNNKKNAIYTDAVGKPLSKPVNPSELASPIDLLNPDRYEFYTFDDNGDLVKRLMSLEEIKSIIATGDSDGLDVDTFTSQGFLPEKRVSDVVNNVQSVLKEEMEVLKDPISRPIFDTPDVSDSWSMILPAVFGNSGEDIKPEKPIGYVTPDTIMIEPNFQTQSTKRPQKTTSYATTMTPYMSTSNAPSRHPTPAVTQYTPVYYSSPITINDKPQSSTEPSMQVEIIANSISTTDNAIPYTSGETEEVPTRKTLQSTTTATLLRNVTKYGTNESQNLSDLSTSTSNHLTTKSKPTTQRPMTQTSKSSNEKPLVTTWASTSLKPTTIGLNLSKVSPTSSIKKPISNIFGLPFDVTQYKTPKPKPSTLSTKQPSSIFGFPLAQDLKSASPLMSISTSAPQKVSVSSNIFELSMEQSQVSSTTPASSRKDLTTTPFSSTTSSVPVQHTKISGSFDDKLSSMPLINKTSFSSVTKTSKPTSENVSTDNYFENTEAIHQDEVSSPITVFASTERNNDATTSMLWTPNPEDSDLFNIFKEVLAQSSSSENQQYSSIALTADRTDVIPETTKIYDGSGFESNEAHSTVSDALNSIPTEKVKSKIPSSINVYDDSPTTKLPTLLNSLNDKQKLSASELLDQLLLTTNIYEINTELASTKFNVSSTVDNININDSLPQTTTTNLDIIYHPPTTDTTLMESFGQLLSQAVDDVQSVWNRTIENTQNAPDVIKETKEEEYDLPTSTTELGTTIEIDSAVENFLSQVTDRTVPDKFVTTELSDTDVTIRRADDTSTVKEFTETTLDSQTVQNEENGESTTYYYVIKKKPIDKTPSQLMNISEGNQDLVKNRTKPAKADLSLEQQLIAEEIKNLTLIKNSKNNDQDKSELLNENETKNISMSTASSEITDTSEIEDFTSDATTIAEDFATEDKSFDSYTTTIPADIETTTNDQEVTSEIGTTEIIHSELAVQSSTMQNIQSSANTSKQSVDQNQTNSTVITENSSVNSSTISPTQKYQTNSTQDETWTLVSTVAPQDALNQNVPPPTIPYQEVLDTPAPVDLVPKPLQGFGLEDTTTSLDIDVHQFVQLCNELAFGFWKTVTNGLSSARSIFVSPFAATSMLAMVFLGAKGATSEEMNEILKLDDMVTFNPHLIFKSVSESVTNEPNSGIVTTAMIRELFSDRSKGKLLDFYKNRVRAFYDGFVEEVSYREIGDVIRRRSNLLVKKYTNGKYPQFFNDASIVPRSPLSGISINIFETDCSKASTEGRDGELHFVVHSSIKQRRLIPIPAAVYKSGFLAGYEPSLDATAVSIGNKEQVVSTILVIPGQQGIAAPGDGLARLEKRLVESSLKKGAWSRLLRSLIPRPGLEVQIPRFSHKSIINATNTLQRMGLHELFNPESADLRGLNGIANELHLSDVLQINKFATCGDKRTEEMHSEVYPATTMRARAARRLHQYSKLDHDEPRDYQRAFHDPLHDPTLLDLPLPLRPRQARIPDVPRLRFDRPFLYFVRHNPTGLILHMGRFNPRLLP